MSEYPNASPEPYSVKKVVPNGYRTEKLPDRTREYVDRIAGELAWEYHREYRDDDMSGDYDARRTSSLSGSRWKWYGRGSERTVASLGRSFRGTPLRDDLTGVVIKFNPWLRSINDVDTTVRKVTESGNLHELAVWKHAVENGHTDLFGIILDYSEWGDWLAMKQTVPVYPYNEPVFANRPIDFIGNCNTAKSMAGWLRKEHEAVGYDPHIKDGNVGFDLDIGHPVCIDFGCHIGVDEFADGAELTEYVLEAENSNQTK